MHLFRNVLKMVKSIDLLIDNKMIPSALIVLYSSIDIVSSLAVMGDRDAQRSDFINWVDKYLVPKLQTHCSGRDIYAARCSVVHTLGSESLLSRRGDAKLIAYVWGDRTSEELQSKLVLLEEEFIVLKIEELTQALREAIAEFFKTEDKELLGNIKYRSQKMFSDEDIFV